MSLQIRPISRADAFAYIHKHHRHHANTPAGDMFRVSCFDGERLCGVALAGRPVSRVLDDGMTIEVSRCCTDGTHNACSILYAALRRAAVALGFTRGLTYILESEQGTSLRAAGWAKAWSTTTKPDGWLNRDGRVLPGVMEQKTTYIWGDWKEVLG